MLPAVPYPSCLHTTIASSVDQYSAQIVPHTLFRQISTLPSNWLTSPSTSLISPSTQLVLLADVLQSVGNYHNYNYNVCKFVWNRSPWHLTPASSLCLQLLWLRCLQSRRDNSLPLQWKLSTRIGPYPWPKYALDNATTPEKDKLLWACCWLICDSDSFKTVRMAL